MSKKVPTDSSSEGKPVSEVNRPDIYRYHDYRQFLNDWIQYRKRTETGFSLRAIAKKSQIAVGYLSMILSGDRKMPHETLEKIAKPLGFTASEKSYLELLRTVSESDSSLAKHEALNRLRKFRAYREENAKEVEVYRYLTHWYYVAVRELAHLPSFRPEPKRIQKQLRNKVSLKEVEEALHFLLENGYLEKRADGSVKPADKEILCLGGVYSLALTQFHREMLELATQSFDNSTVEERDITGYTLAIPQERLGDLKKMCFEFLRQVATLEDKTQKPDSVYHVTVAAIPLTQKSKKEEE